MSVSGYTKAGADAAFHKVFTPERYGAAGNGSTNDAVAIQAAIDAAAAAGGGVVQLDAKRYAWSGDIVVKNLVTLAGPGTRQPPASAGTVPGLLALGSTSRLYVGSWTVTGAGAGAGVSRLYVDGNNVGGVATGGAGLVRVEGVDLHISDLFVVNSAGDGLVFNATQNSTILGGHSTNHAGAALVLDNGAGALSFHGGYYGTSNRVLVLRDTPGEANQYPFGPVQNNWFGTIFEQYNRSLTETAHVEIRCGAQNAFFGCNFTHGAPTTASAPILISNADAATPTSVTFHNCLYGPAASAADVIRIVGAQYVILGGYNTASAAVPTGAFICQDSGVARVVIDGELSGVPVGQLTRAINGGSLIGFYNWKDAPPQYRLNTGQHFAVQHPTDTVSRGQITGDFDHLWYDGSSGTLRASIVKDTSGKGLAFTGGTNLKDGPRSVAHALQFNVTVGAALTLDASASSYHIIQSTANLASVAISNAVDDMELTFGLFMSAGVTLTAWPTDARFAANTPPTPVGNTYTFVTFRRLASIWLEISRSVGVPAS